jgi:hypothetical protein
MDRRTFLGAVVSGLLAAPLAVEAQQTGKSWRVGFLTPGFKELPGSNPGLAPLSQGLRELGYLA